MSLAAVDLRILAMGRLFKQRGRVQLAVAMALLIMGLTSCSRERPVHSNLASKPKLPDDMRDTAQAAADFFKDKRYDEAADQYQRIIDKYPDCLYACSNLGVVRFQQGRLEEAIAAFEKAVELSPNDAFSLSNLGICYYQSKRYDEAIAVLEKAVALDPNDAKSHNYLGCCYSQKGRQADAQREFDKAIQLDHYFGDAYYNRALVFTVLNPPDLEKARNNYEMALKLGVAREPKLEKLLQNSNGP